MIANRPRILLSKTKADKLIEVLSFICVCACWLVTLLFYNSLPDIIPVHYNLKGDIDNYGAKGTIWLLPLIVTMITAGMHSLTKYPHYLNYMVKITEQNAEVEYKFATRLLRVLHLAVAVIFLFILVDIIFSARMGHSFLGVWFVPAVLLLSLVMVLLTVFRKKP